MERYLKWKETPDGKWENRADNYFKLLDNYDRYLNSERGGSYKNVLLRAERFADLCGIDKDVVIKYLEKHHGVNYYNLARALYDDGYLKDEYIEFKEDNY